MLTSEEVTSINSLLKSGARRYLAADDKTWLFPENTWRGSWEDIGRVLLPPSDMLWGFGGEIYIGYKNGSTQYRRRVWPNRYWSQVLGEESPAHSA